MLMGRVWAKTCRVRAGSVFNPARFETLGQKGCAGCAGCAGFVSRAGAYLCGGLPRVNPLLLFFLARKKVTMHTLHTLHKRWESKAKNVQGLFLTLHVPCTYKKTDRGDGYAG